MFSRTRKEHLGNCSQIRLSKAQLGHTTWRRCRDPLCGTCFHLGNPNAPHPHPHTAPAHLHRPVQSYELFLAPLNSLIFQMPPGPYRVRTSKVFPLSSHFKDGFSLNALSLNPFPGCILFVFGDPVAFCMDECVFIYYSRYHRRRHHCQQHNIAYEVIFVCRTLW